MKRYLTRFWLWLGKFVELLRQQMDSSVTFWTLVLANAMMFYIILLLIGGEHWGDPQGEVKHRFFYHIASFTLSIAFALLFAWISRTSALKKRQQMELGFAFIALACTVWGNSSFLILVLNLFKILEPRSLQAWVAEITSNFNTLFFLYVIPFLQFDKEPKWIEQLDRKNFYKILFLIGVGLVAFYAITTFWYWPQLHENSLQLSGHPIKIVSASLTLLSLIPFILAFYQIFEERVPNFKYVFLFVAFVLLMVCLNDLLGFIKNDEMYLLLSFSYRILLLLVFLVLANSYYVNTDRENNAAVQKFYATLFPKILQEKKVEQIKQILHHVIQELINIETSIKLIGLEFIDTKNKKKILCYYLPEGDASNSGKVVLQISIHRNKKDLQAIIKSVDWMQTHHVWRLSDFGRFYLYHEPPQLSERQEKVIASAVALLCSFGWATNEKIWPEIRILIGQIQAKKNSTDYFHDKFNKATYRLDIPDDRNVLYSDSADFLICSIDALDAAYGLNVNGGQYHALHPFNLVMKGITDRQISPGIVWFLAIMAEAKQRNKLLNEKIDNGYFIKKWREEIEKCSCNDYLTNESKTLSAFFRGEKRRDNDLDIIENIYDLIKDLSIVKGQIKNNVLGIEYNVSKFYISFVFGLLDVELFLDKVKRNKVRYRKEQDLIGDTSKRIALLELAYLPGVFDFKTYTHNLTKSGALTLTFNFSHDIF